MSEGSPTRLQTWEENQMPRVELGAPAPDFDLEDFNGARVRLSDFQRKRHVVLVFNRGFG